MFNLISSCSHPVLKNNVVFMLMVMVIIFRDSCNVETNHISDQYWTMLTRWLEKINREQGNKRMMDQRMDDTENILYTLGGCMNILPLMLDMQAELL